MVFRTEARISALFVAGLLIAGLQSSPAQSSNSATVEVRHRHFRGGEAGELRVTDDGILFVEYGKPRGHSRTWKFDNIQRLELSESTLRILTYEDRKWTGADREFVFDHLPLAFPDHVYALWRDALDQRFVAALPDVRVDALWQLPVKLPGLIQGSQGDLLVAADRIVYRTETPGQSRTWRFADIENVASSGRFDFSLVTSEREFRFQLKQALDAARFDQLWRRLNDSRESEFIRKSAASPLL